MELYEINRFALIIAPTADMIKWVNNLFPDSPEEHQPFGSHDNADVYLLPEFEDIEEAEEWLKENYSRFFEEALIEWTEDEAQWPDDMSWDTFRRFCQYSIQSVVIDTVGEQYDEEY